MHSNVGGGYPRAGMANVAFYWMLERLDEYGDLKYKPDVKRDALDHADPNGLMYDSRGGAAVFFRYHPREIKTLCEDKLTGTIKIHESVLKRMSARTANYGPAHLPGRFEAATSQILKGGAAGKIYEPEGEKGWLAIQKSIGWFTWSRKWLYALFLDFWIVVAAFAFWLWIYYPIDKATKMISPNWWLKHIADILDYFLPQFFDAFIQVVVVQRPLILLFGVVILLFLGFCAGFARRKTEEACEVARKITLGSGQPVED